jgi:ABC-type nitrate/sulfonate/bicarbonate transport system permease component
VALPETGPRLSDERVTAPAPEAVPAPAPAAGGRRVRRGRRRRSGLRRALPWITTLGVLTVWELLARAGVFPAEFPPLTEVGEALWNMVGAGSLGPAVWETVSQFAVALVCGSIVGVVLGVLLGKVHWVHRVTHLVLDFLRLIPAIVYLPLLLLLMGGRPETAMLVGAVGALWPVLFQTFYGVNGVSPVMRDTGRVYGLTAVQKLWSITLPTVLPFVATGLRIAASHVLVVVVAVELIVGVPGLGADIGTFSQGAAYPQMYALIFVTGVLGFLVNAGLIAVERRRLAWHVSYRQEQSA